MDYSKLKQCSFKELKKMAKDMGLPSRRSVKEYINEIQEAFKEYEEYKTKKIDKYTKIRQLGNKGKEGTTYLVSDTKGKEFAMKTFRKSKSSTTLKREYVLQKRAAGAGVAPRVVEYDCVSKYIVMERMDNHLYDVMKKQKGNLLRSHQLEIISIFDKLDEIGVFHADSNILNYMIKKDKIYLIDFGFAKEITSKLCDKLGTKTPNRDIMTLGLVLKLKELNCPTSSWKYLKKFISIQDLDRFKIL